MALNADEIVSMGQSSGPSLNQHEERAARLLGSALSVDAQTLRLAVHEIVLATRSAVDVRTLDRDITHRGR